MRLPSKKASPDKTAYRIANDALATLSKAKSTTEMVYIYQDLSEEIRRAHTKEGTGDLSELCRNYVAKHIRTSFSIQQMTDDL